MFKESASFETHACSLLRKF